MLCSASRKVSFVPVHLMCHHALLQVGPRLPSCFALRRLLTLKVHLCDERQLAIRKLLFCTCRAQGAFAMEFLAVLAASNIPQFLMHRDIASMALISSQQPGLHGLLRSVVCLCMNCSVAMSVCGM